MLVGTDGKQKMSQSLGNYIGLTEDAKNMFGKTMSIPDEAIVNYYELAARASREKITKINKRLEDGENPKEIKEDLAYDIVKLYHGEDVATKTKEEFDSVFSKGEIPENITEKKLENRQRNIVDLLVELELASSKSEARRLVAQGGVKVDQSKIVDPSTRVSTHSGTIVQVGKLKYIKIV
jgi:tyrosyl-tRNA synthetase